MIEYKAKWYGKQVVTVAKNFPSSQLCSAVAIKTKTLKILDCVNGSVLNAMPIIKGILTQVLNLKNEAIRLLTVGADGARLIRKRTDRLVFLGIPHFKQTVRSIRRE